MLNVLTASLQGQSLTTISIHRLGRGLPGYLILFAPHAFVPQCQYHSSKSPSLLVFLVISTDFTPTPLIPLAPPELYSNSFECTSMVKP